MFRDKEKNLDARNALGLWSFIKWVVDVVMAICPFALWWWHITKIVMDTPLVILWLVGKIQAKCRGGKDGQN